MVHVIVEHGEVSRMDVDEILVLLMLVFSRGSVARFLDINQGRD
jgi:hypothetical protein